MSRATRKANRDKAKAKQSRAELIEIYRRREQAGSRLDGALLRHLLRDSGGSSEYSEPGEIQNIYPENDVDGGGGYDGSSGFGM